MKLLLILIPILLLSGCIQKRNIASQQIAMRQAELTDELTEEYKKALADHEITLQRLLKSKTENKQLKDLLIEKIKEIKMLQRKFKAKDAFDKIIKGFDTLHN